MARVKREHRTKLLRSEDMDKAKWGQNRNGKRGPSRAALADLLGLTTGELATVERMISASKAGERRTVCICYADAILSALGEAHLLHLYWEERRRGVVLMARIGMITMREGSGWMRET